MAGLTLCSHIVSRKCVLSPWMALKPEEALHRIGKKCMDLHLVLLQGFAPGTCTSCTHDLRRFSTVIKCTSPLISQYDSTVQEAVEVGALPAYHKRIVLAPSWCPSSGKS
ncbi:hypothetical protein AKJ16_DCAP00722 [Drosera capensis]